MRKALLATVASGAAAALALVGSSAPASAAGWNPSVLVQNTSATEPGIDIAPDGTMYVHAPTGVGSVSPIWRSTTNGASWTVLPSTTRVTGPGGGDIDLAIAPDTGRVAYTDLWLGSAGVGFSNNRGDFWTAQPFSAPVQDRQWVAATNGGVVYHLTHQLESGLMMSKSVDGGLTYPAHTYAATAVDQSSCLCPSGPIIAEPGTGIAGTTDKVGVPFTYGNGIKFARSINGGATFTRHIIDLGGGPDTSSSFPVVANAGGNVLHAAWLEVGSGFSRIMYSRSADWGVTWTPPAAVVASGTPVFPWIDARGSKVVIAFYHTTNSGTPDTVATNSQWFVKSVESTTGGTGWNPVETADSTAAKVGRVCTNGLACSSGREFGDFLMVAISPTTSKATISYNRVPGTRQVRTVTQA